MARLEKTTLAAAEGMDMVQEAARAVSSTTRMALAAKARRASASSGTSDLKKEKNMNIAIISSGKVTDACVFDDFSTAQDFLSMGVWPGAEMVLELPDGYGIGDSYDAATGEWTKAPEPEPEPPIDPPEPEPTVEERLAAAEDKNRVLEAKVKAQNESITMLEDCIVEMAGVVYA